MAAPDAESDVVERVDVDLDPRSFLGLGGAAVAALVAFAIARSAPTTLTRLAVGLVVGIALTPRLGRGPLPPDTVAVRVHDPIPAREAIVLWRRSQGRSPAVRAVVEALAEAGSQLGT